MIVDIPTTIELEDDIEDVFNEKSCQIPIINLDKKTVRFEVAEVYGTKHGTSKRRIVKGLDGFTSNTPYSDVII